MARRMPQSLAISAQPDCSERPHLRHVFSCLPGPLAGSRRGCCDHRRTRPADQIETACVTIWPGDPVPRHAEQSLPGKDNASVMTRNFRNDRMPSRCRPLRRRPPSPARWRRPRLRSIVRLGIVVCIPSFRRPQHLRLTLESLARQRTDRRFAVVIVENDAAGCGSVPVAANFCRPGDFPACAWSSRGKAIATRSMPRSRPRWRRFPPRSFPDDR